MKETLSLEDLLALGNKIRHYECIERGNTTDEMDEKITNVRTVFKGKLKGLTLKVGAEDTLFGGIERNPTYKYFIAGSYEGVFVGSYGAGYTTDERKRYSHSAQIRPLFDRLEKDYQEKDQSEEIKKRRHHEKVIQAALESARNLLKK